MSLEPHAWKMECDGKDPLRALANLVHLNPEHDMARCQLVAALLLSVWQLSGPAFSDTTPSFMLVNASPGGDAAWTALLDILKRCMEAPERTAEQDTRRSVDPNKGNPVRCRQTMLATMARMRTFRASGASPVMVKAEIAKQHRGWTKIKAELFPNLSLRELSAARDPDFEWVTEDDDRISVLIQGRRNRDLLLRLLQANPSALDFMMGIGSSMELVRKRVALIGEVPAAEWNARLTTDLLASGHPVFFLPHDSPATIKLADIDLLRSLVRHFTRYHRFHSPPMHADPCTVQLDDEALNYLNLILRLTRPLPGETAFQMQVLLRRLQSVAMWLPVWAAETQEGAATTRYEPAHVVGDLYVTALRGIAYGLAALRYHRIGHPSLENDPHAGDVLDFLREIERPTSRRELLRKVHTLSAKRRDELIARLKEADLVTTTGKHVEAVRFSDYVAGIPEREKFPAVTLLTSEHIADEVAGKPSAA